MSNSTVRLQNPHLRTMKADVLYHLGLSTGTHDLVEMFGDVKFVCMGGTAQRMESFAHYIMKEINFRPPPGTCLQDMTKHSHRYSMFKVGPVLSISHGMGVPSLSILLHEVIKLLAHAGARDPIFFRVGTSGGVGLDGGTVVVTEEAVDGMLEAEHKNIILGELVSRPSKVDKAIAQELVDIGKDLPFDVVTGKTVCTDDFYEGQGRLDGAFCEFDEERKMTYLRRLNEAGVKNIEMEATCFAALTHMAGIRSAVVCVTLLNRLNGDQITSTKDALTGYQTRPQRLVGEYIRRHLHECRSNPVSPGGRASRLQRMPTISLYTSYEDEAAPNGKMCRMPSTDTA